MLPGSVLIPLLQHLQQQFSARGLWPLWQTSFSKNICVMIHNHSKKLELGSSNESIFMVRGHYNMRNFIQGSQHWKDWEPQIYGLCFSKPMRSQHPITQPDNRAPHFLPEYYTLQGCILDLVFVPWSIVTRRPGLWVWLGHSLATWLWLYGNILLTIWFPQKGRL